MYGLITITPTWFPVGIFFLLVVSHIITSGDFYHTLGLVPNTWQRLWILSPSSGVHSVLCQQINYSWITLILKGIPFGLCFLGVSRSGLMLRYSSAKLSFLGCSPYS